MNTIQQSSVFQINEEISWENVALGIQRQILGYDEKIMMAKVKFEKNAIGSLHTHYHSQATYVESGVFELSIDNEKKILKTGDGYFVPPNVIHGCVCIKPGTLIDVFSPLREDFLIAK